MNVFARRSILYFKESSLKDGMVGMGVGAGVCVTVGDGNGVDVLAGVGEVNGIFGGVD